MALLAIPWLFPFRGRKNKPKIPHAHIHISVTSLSSSSSPSLFSLLSLPCLVLRCTNLTSFSQVFILFSSWIAASRCHCYEWPLLLLPPIQPADNAHNTTNRILRPRSAGPFCVCFLGLMQIATALLLLLSLSLSLSPLSLLSLSSLSLQTKKDGMIARDRYT